MPRGDASRRYKSILYCRIRRVVPLHNNALPSAETREPRSVDYRHSIDRRLHRQPSPPRSPRARSIFGEDLPLVSPPSVPPSLLTAGRVFARDARRGVRRAPLFPESSLVIKTATLGKVVRSRSTPVYASGPSKFPVDPSLIRARGHSLSDKTYIGAP